MAKTKKNGSSGKSLVIVESPAKAKTINRYLGKDYVVKASMGHVRDLPDHDLGIDIDNNFAPTYGVVTSRKKTIKELHDLAQNAELVYLATDLDREGEAIAWHLVEALELDESRIKRVIFNEITESAIHAAFDHPLTVNMDKVNAQQARRTLDRIVGYQLSPLLWQKIAKGLSAGRVQSVAVRLIVEREREIRAFVPTESWRIQAVFTAELAKRAGLAGDWDKFLTTGKDGNPRTQKERIAWLSDHGCFQAELVSVSGETFKPGEHEHARKVAEALGFVCDKVDEVVWEDYARLGLKKVQLIGSTPTDGGPTFRISDIQKKRTTTRPSAPFTTATLQQAASSSLGFSASRTMRVAQSLYEGLDLGGKDGPVGLITYMRTDSTQLSKDSVASMRELIQQDYGENYLPAKPNVYGKKSKRAQEAHEAIRPSDVRLTPDSLKERMSTEQWKLYDLIWRRTVACQMTPAQWDSTTLFVSADTSVGEATFKATGRRLVFDGFQRVAKVKATDDVVLPELETGHEVTSIKLDPEQQYTSPPPRFSEASLVKALEAEGIGRPSTYAAIIQTIQDRGYVEQIDRRMYATDKGQVVTDKLIEHFPDIVDVKFTSYMEDELDKIEESHLDWVHVLREFYEPFKKSLDKASTEMAPARAEPSEYTCDDCGKPMVYRWSRTGRFLSCTGYPECKGAANIDREGKPIPTVKAEVDCELCGKPMILRQSRHGSFLGCSGYPECSHIVPCTPTGEPLKLVKDEELESPCEQCDGGTMKVKRAGFRTFMGCDNYPKCKNTSPLPEGFRVEKKTLPVEDAGFGCEKCGQPMQIKTGRRGKFIACSGFPRCRTTKPIEKLDELRQMAEEGKLPKPTPEQIEAAKNSAKNGKKSARKEVPRTPDGKIDYEAMGPPPEGYAWTRTGRPVVETWPEDELKCAECGNEMRLRSGRFGPFFSCSGFPKCKFSANLRGEAKKRGEIEMPAPKRAEPIPTQIACDECDQKMMIREGRTGKFLGCSGYPKCKATKPMPPEMAEVGAEQGN